VRQPQTHVHTNAFSPEGPRISRIRCRCFSTLIMSLLDASPTLQYSVKSRAAFSISPLCGRVMLCLRSAASSAFHVSRGCALKLINNNTINTHLRDFENQNDWYVTMQYCRVTPTECISVCVFTGVAVQKCNYQRVNARMSHLEFLWRHACVHHT